MTMTNIAAKHPKVCEGKGKGLKEKNKTTAQIKITKGYTLEAE